MSVEDYRYLAACLLAFIIGVIWVRSNFRNPSCDHRTVRGYCNGLPYFRITNTTTDGIGREHAWLETECAICHEKFTIGMVHLPKRKEDKP